MVWIRNYLYCSFVFLAAIVLGGMVYAAEGKESITVDDLANRVQVCLISLAPDGSRVAYLTAKGLPAENQYEVQLSLSATNGNSQALSLSRYRLPPDQALERDTGVIQKTAGQLAWSPDGDQLAFTTHVGSQMEVRIKTLGRGSERVLLSGFEKIEMAAKDHHLEFTVTNPARRDTGARSQPEDFGLLIKDAYRFFGPLSNPKTHGLFAVEHWEYTWGNTSAVKSSHGVGDSLSYLGFPKEWSEIRSSSGTKEYKTPDAITVTHDEARSPSGALVAMIEDSAIDLADPALAHRTSRIVVKDLKNPQAGAQVLVPSDIPRAMRTILGWSTDERELYYVSVDSRFSSINAVGPDGHVREIHKEESGFSLPSGSSEVSSDRSVVVLVRTTNVIPDELVKIDLKTGGLIVIASPNKIFASKEQPTIRFMPIDCCNADFYGRLYLPVDYEKGKRYPLVFTNYVSGPGFDASVGDEVPILALVAHGLAVFAMNSREANITSTTGDFRSEIGRVEKPLRAMEWVHSKLVHEGIVAPEQCGLTGLSYGTEIAMYAYWKSKAFRAVSVATGGWEPMNYIVGGITYSKSLDSRGFIVPGDGSYSKWKELSAGLNTRSDLPPLLIQSPDGEEYTTVETWFRLRRVGAPVDWYEYPGEGHVKRGPANKWWVYTRNLDWFRFWLQDYEDPDPGKAEQYKRWRELRKLQESNAAKAAGQSPN